MHFSHISMNLPDLNFQVVPNEIFPLMPMRKSKKLRIRQTSHQIQEQLLNGQTLKGTMPLVQNMV